jgi:hypothetical protein
MAACFTHSLLSFPNNESQDRLATLRCFLPASEEVMRLKAIFYTACISAHDPVPEESFELVFSAVYEVPWSTSDGDEARILHMHAVMFMFLALASAYDPALPPHVSPLVLYSYAVCARALIIPQERLCCCVLRACVCVSCGHKNVRSTNARVHSSYGKPPAILCSASIAS